MKCVPIRFFPHPLLVAVMLLLAFWGQALFGSVRLSLTTDEPMHIAMGYTELTTGDYGFLPQHIHPPLVNEWAAWPLLLRPDRPDPRQMPGWAEGNLWTFSAQLLAQLGPVESVELATRVPIMLLALLLGALVYRWASDLLGVRAGLIALLLYAFDPGILSNSQFNTTDIGATAFGVLATLIAWRAVKAKAKMRPTARLSSPKSTWRIALIGLALGMSMASKVSGLFFAPMLTALVGITLLKAHWGRWDEFGKQVLRWAMRFALIYALALGVVWAVYRFEWGTLPGVGFPVPAASHWLVLQAFSRHVVQGHYAFLAGQVGQHGWWWYFPLALVIKTPLPTLLLLVIALISRLRLGPSQRASWTDDVWLLAIPVVYFINAVFSTIDIGYRHLLPIFPFLFIFIAVQVAGRKMQDAECKSHASRAGHTPVTVRTFGSASPCHLVTLSPCHLVTLSVLFLLAWYIVGTLSIFPDYVAYFNELVGGADGGYRYLVDSNTDWGQTLKELKRYVDAHGISNVNLSQFTFIDPGIYGLSYRPIAPMKGAPPVLPARFNPTPGVYAISTTTLQGIPLADPEQFDWFRRRAPEAQVGHAMFVYRVEAASPLSLRPRAWVAQCTTPATPLEPAQVAEGFGRDDLRLAYFDCAQSWLYPTGGQAPGWFALTQAAQVGDARWLAATRLSYEQKRAGFFPPFRIYEYDGSADYSAGRGRVHIAPSAQPLPDALATPAVDLPVTFGNGLTLLGFTLEQPVIKPGGTAYVKTVWRVDSVPGRLLSIMAHMLGPDGRAVAVGDGLGVPIESWQPGDVFVQRHTLTAPKDAPPGSYWIQTGVYWLDNEKRWPVQDARVAGDRALLVSVQVQ